MAKDFSKLVEKNKIVNACCYLFEHNMDNRGLRAHARAVLKEL
jgi:hypothetical protein